LRLTVASTFVACAFMREAYGATSTSALGEIEQREAQQQRERDEAVTRANVPKPEVRLQPDPKLKEPSPTATQESPCFEIGSVRLEGDTGHDFDWLVRQFSPDAHGVKGQCLGAMGVNQLRAQMQNALIDRGWITTRLMVPDQDLTTGMLTLLLAPGRMTGVRMADGSAVPDMVYSALPTRPGQLLNLRDIEQALENIKRAPSQDADIQIEPSRSDKAQQGDSTLVVSLKKVRPLRISASVDDSGSEATGKYQGSVTLSYDTPLQRNDLFYLSLNHSLGAATGGGGGTEGFSYHYSLPLGYWQASLSGNGYRYHQTVSDAAVYSGESGGAEISVERMAYRDASTKIKLGGSLWYKNSKNFLNDTEVLIQRRRTAGWALSGDAQTYLGQTQITAELALRHGTGALSSLPAHEEQTGSGTSRFYLLSTQFSVSRPFSWAGHPFQYRILLKGQIHGTRLTPQERFSIGSRYTVRGFDGKNSLAGDSGLVVRNEWITDVPPLRAQLYWGLDGGRVFGPSTEQGPPGRTLVGAALGLRGSFKGLGFDLFAGRPLHKPSTLETSTISGGFNLNLSY
jgi:hemolysin activation/secretion protein